MFPNIVANRGHHQSNFLHFSAILLLFFIWKSMHWLSLWKHMFIYTDSFYNDIIYLNTNFSFSLHFISCYLDLMLVELQLFLAHRLYYIIYLNELYTIMIPKILHFFCILFHPNWTWSGQVTHFSLGNAENSSSDDAQTFPDRLMGEGFIHHRKSQISYHFWWSNKDSWITHWVLIQMTWSFF